MKKFEEKRKFRRALYSRPSVALLVLASIFIGSEIWGWYGKYSESGENRAIAERKLVRLKYRENQLRAEIAALKTEQGIEREIRTKFGLVRPGERVIVVVPAPENPKQSASAIEGGVFNRVWGRIIEVFR